MSSKPRSLSYLLVSKLWTHIRSDEFWHWAKEAILEWRQWTRGADFGHTVGFPNEKYIAIPSHSRSFFSIVPPLLHRYESRMLVYLPTPTIFAYYIGLTLKTTRRDLLFRVAISKYCVLTLIPFSCSVLIAAQSWLRKAFSGDVDLVLECSLFSTFYVREFVEAVEFFKINRQRPFDAPSAFLAYWRSAEIISKTVVVCGGFPKTMWPVICWV